MCIRDSTSSGSRNIALGYCVRLPSATGNDQLAIGCGTGRWISGDSSFNTTLAGIVTATAAGAVCATTMNASGTITASRYNGDADCNIIMGHQAGIAVTPASTDVCGTVIIGRCAAQRLRCGGNRAVFIGDNAGEHMNCSEGSVLSLIHI